MQQAREAYTRACALEPRLPWYWAELALLDNPEPIKISFEDLGGAIEIFSGGQHIDLGAQGLSTIFSAVPPSGPIRTTNAMPCDVDPSSMVQG